MEDARDALVNKCVDILGVYKTHVLGSGQNPQLMALPTFKFLPMLTLGLIKHVT